jgi:hypothetical protein
MKYILRLHAVIRDLSHADRASGSGAISRPGDAVLARFDVPKHR